MTPFLLLLALAATPAQEETTAPTRIEDLALEFSPPALEGLRAALRPGGQLRARWTGRREGRDLALSLFGLPRREWRLGDPAVVLARVAEQQRFEGGLGRHPFDRSGLLAGPFGTLPVAGWAEAGAVPGPDGRARSLVVLCGLGRDEAWVLQVELAPPAPAEDLGELRRLLAAGLRYLGETEDPRWTDEEARARWERDRPEDLQGRLRIERTDHYLILTNSSSGRTFGRKMEEAWERIRSTYPFPDLPGRKLLPVFLFRTKEEYVSFYAAIAGIDREQAARSKGHAWRDYYATFYDAPGDPVHIHEATHQIFRNRLGLSGGGSWFQEGVAEYLSTTANERRAWARRAARDGTYTPFRDFVGIPSLLRSAGGERNVRGGSVAGGHYLQAASIIAFLRESDFGAERFPDFLREVGSVRGGEDEVEAAIRRVYGCSLPELEREWVEFWRRRR
ncbi:MAG: hypothetical protein D6702_09475 [Planctomycetota bacterium]|nr:MAG: hypothetical protein D6702_09475 [Planctomycetota bacterium]